MRLFDTSESISLTLSQEEFKEYYKTASVISQEALSDYLFKIKDMTSTLTSRIFDLDKDKIAIDFSSTRFETEHVIKRINFNEFKHTVVNKPINFKGRYLDYSKDLLVASTTILEDSIKTLTTLKLAIGGFINEYSENKVNLLYGYQYFKDSEKIVDKYTKVISSYFPNKNSSVKAPVSDLIRTPSDVTNIYSVLSDISNIVNEKSIEQVSTLTKDVTMLVDSLIEQNKSSGVLLKTERTKKELIEALHIAAREVEALAYMYSNIIYLYSAIKNLSEHILANK